MSSGGCLVPAGEGHGAHADRGSRFLGYAFYLEDAPAFAPRLAALRREHASARHHCWAWRLPQAYRFHDDGEPGGTAGRPILQAIDAAGLVHVAVVVVRYFGGVKLGTGGLVRAYGAAAQCAVGAAGAVLREPRRRLRLHLPFDLLGLRSALEAAAPGLLWRDQAYDEQGWAGVAEVPAGALPGVEDLLRERGAGRVGWEELPD